MSNVENSIEIIDSSTGLSYSFSINSKYTVVQGKSGTGKTTLIQLLNQHYLNRVNRVYNTIQISGIYTFIPIPNDIVLGDISKRLKTIVEYNNVEVEKVVFFADETLGGINSKKLQDAMTETSYHFLIVTRSPLGNVPYGIEDVYEIVTDKRSRRKHTLDRIWKDRSVEFSKFSILKTEDSTSGYSFFSKYLINVDHCDGKSTVLDDMQNNYGILYVVDGVRFGSEIKAVQEWLENNQFINDILIIPSFEKLLLDCELFTRESVQKHLTTLDDVPSICNNKETFYYLQLRRTMTVLGQKYSKSDIGKCFLSDCCDRLNYHTHKHEDPCILYLRGDKFQIVMRKQLAGVLRRCFGDILSKNAKPDQHADTASEYTSAFQSQ